MRCSKTHLLIRRQLHKLSTIYMWLVFLSFPLYNISHKPRTFLHHIALYMLQSSLYSPLENFVTCSKFTSPICDTTNQHQTLCSIFFTTSKQIDYFGYCQVNYLCIIHAHIHTQYHTHTYTYIYIHAIHA